MFQRGFTLIELMVSIMLGMILLSIAVNSLMQISRAMKRNEAHRQAHDDAALIYQSLHDNLETVYHPSLMILQAKSGADDPAWGTGDETLSLIWMSTLRAVTNPEVGIREAAVHDLTWNMLQWQGVAPDLNEPLDIGVFSKGTLLYGLSSPRRVVTDYTYGGLNPIISTAPQPRRDRRRDLDDNDLRFVPGINAATKGSNGINMPGDLEDLEANLRPLHGAATLVEDFAFSWTDAQKRTITCDARNGVVAGASALGGTPVVISSEEIDGVTVEVQTYVVDGTFLDGRPHVPDGITSSGDNVTMGERPALIRLAFNLISTSQTGLALKDEPRFDFSMSLSTTPNLPPH